MRLINRNITLLHCSDWRSICCIGQCFSSSKFSPLRMSDITEAGCKFTLKQSSWDISLLKQHLHSSISEIAVAEWNFCQRSITNLRMVWVFFLTSFPLTWIYITTEDECNLNTMHVNKWSVLIQQHFAAPIIHYFTTLKEKLSPLEILESLSEKKKWIAFSWSLNRFLFVMMTHVLLRAREKVMGRKQWAI